MRVFSAAFVYFAIAFAAGFLFAIPRTLLIEPRLGALVAVMVEAPFMLTVCWFAAGFALQRFAPGASAPARAIIGALWLVLLLLAEFGVGLWARGLAPAEAFAAFFTAPGLAGLALQALCATFPLLRR
jgi:hypothetical protein